MTTRYSSLILLLIAIVPQTRFFAQAPKLVLPIGHSSAIVAAQFSPDGQKIVTASDDNKAKIWDASSGLLLADLDGHTHKVRSVDFSADGTRIVTSAYDHTARIWDATTGAFLLELKGPEERVESAHFNPAGDKVITSSWEIIQVWDAAEGSLLDELPASGERRQAFSPDGTKFLTRNMDTFYVYDMDNRSRLRLSGKVGAIVHADFSPTGNEILIGTFDSLAMVWDVTTGKQLKRFRTTGAVQTARFSPDGKMVLTATQDDNVMIWDYQSGKLLRSFRPGGGLLLSAGFHPDGSRILTASRGGTMSLWDVQTGKRLRKLDGHINYIYLMFGEFSRDGSKIISGSEDKTTRVWDVATGRELLNMRGHARIMKSGRFNENATRAELANWDNNDTEFWDLMTGVKLDILEGRSYYDDYEDKILVVKWNEVEVQNREGDSILQVLSGHQDFIFSAQFSRDGNKALTVSNDHTNRVWNVNTGEEIIKFFGVDSLGFFAQIPSGHYQTDAESAKLLHYVTPDLKFITFEQLDVRYNRPDKVLEALGNPDTALIRSYRQAWEKRIRRLDLDTSSFRDDLKVPDADFMNRKEISFEQKDRTLTLHLFAQDSSYALDRFNIWVNEVPVYGQRGFSLRSRNIKTLDSVAKVLLSSGLNKIEYSVTNTNGLESYRMPLLVNYKQSPIKTTVYFLGIGIDQFKDSQYNLTYSTKDIRDLAIALKKRYGTSVIIDTLFNQNVTRENVAALKEKIKQSSVDDRVILAYSGHGLLNNNFDYFLSTYPIDFDNPGGAGIPYDEMENLMDSIPARQKLMLIDACHSGEVDKEDVEQLDVTTAAGVKGLKPVAYKKQGQLGLKNSFELMKTLFVNVGKSTGAVIISAAGGTEFALEGGKFSNGVFTHSLLKVLQSSKSIKISELRKRVTTMVSDLTEGLQRPTGRSEMIAVDWEL